MPSDSEIPSQVVYIGGIPFDQTEEQVLEVARTVGPVVQLQLIFDKETGKSKGYAFVRYPDEQTAASAVRNLNRYAIGNRELKCNFAKEEAMADPFGGQQQAQQTSTQADGQTQARGQGTAKNRKKQSIPPLPAGIDVYNELPGDYITRELQRMDQTRLSNVLRDSIKMAKMNPALMEELLVKSPQLSYAIVQASMMVNAIGEQDLAGLVKQANDAAPAEAHAPAEKFANLTDEQKKLVRQVVHLSDAEMAGLSDEQRRSVYLLKGQYLGQV